MQFQELHQKPHKGLNDNNYLLLKMGTTTIALDPFCASRC